MRHANALFRAASSHTPCSRVRPAAERWPVGAAKVRGTSAVPMQSAEAALLHFPFGAQPGSGDLSEDLSHAIPQVQGGFRSTISFVFGAGWPVVASGLLFKDRI